MNLEVVNLGKKHEVIVKIVNLDRILVPLIRYHSGIRQSVDVLLRKWLVTAKSTAASARRGRQEEVSASWNPLYRSQVRNSSSRRLTFATAVSDLVVEPTIAAGSSSNIAMIVWHTYYCTGS